MYQLRDKSRWRAGSKKIVRRLCDIPVPQTHWGEPVAEVKQCPCCKPKNQAAFDHILDRDPSSEVMSDPDIRAYVLYLSLQQIIPLNRIAAHVSDFYGVPVSTGTILEWLQKASEGVQTSHANNQPTPRQRTGPGPF